MIDIPALQEEAIKAQEMGEALFQKLLPELKTKKIQPGTFVAIEIQSGKYVTGKTRLELMHTYEKEFGDSTGWVRRVRREDVEQN